MIVYILVKEINKKMKGGNNLCKLGDIIVVRNYIGEGGNNVNQHSFVVVSDEGGTISGLDYTMVAATISSFKNKEHRNKKLKYEENMELPINSKENSNWNKEGYIKADQAYYFNKNKLDYYVFASLKKEYLDELLKLILKLAKEEKLKIITDNL